MNGDPTLLVVDDEASNLESLERIFAREGLAVLTAKDGKDALEIVRKRRVDVPRKLVVLCDVSGSVAGFSHFNKRQSLPASTTYSTPSISSARAVCGAAPIFRKSSKKRCANPSLPEATRIWCC